jgi:nitrous oxide reductase accessory protein NosL
VGDVDLWTPEVQEAVLKLIVALLGIVATWATVKAKNWLVAAEAKALAEAREKGGAMLEQAVRLGIQYAEQVASKQVAKWTNEDKLNAAVEFVQVRFPEVPAEEIDRMIDAVIKDVKAWWLEQHPDSAAEGGAQ